MLNYDELKVVIFGWYGTETLGDKAILGGIIEDLLEKGVVEENIEVLSLNIEYTKLTMVDLNYSRIEVSDVRAFKQNLIAIEEKDWFIFGGGPLCDVEEMIDMFQIIYQANSMGKETIIYACGIGPLNIDRYKFAFKEIIQNSSKIGFRDKLSTMKYSELLFNVNRFSTMIDPAVLYLRKKILEPIKRVEKSEYTMLCIRKLPHMYTHGVEQEKYNNMINGFEKSIVEFVKYTNGMGQKVIFFPMHNYCVGDDDREYYLELCEKYDLWEMCEIIGHEYLVEEAISYFKYAKKVVAMRFHSVVFATTLNTPFIPIDYQYDDGKVSGFLQEIEADFATLKIKDFTENNISFFDREYNFNWKSINEKLTLAVQQLNNFL